MADYYNLLSRAVSGLPNPTSDSRKAIYERARKALLGQLRAMQPPVPEADIQRESDALDAAIARLEAEREGGAPPPAASPPAKAPAPQPPTPPAAPQSPESKPAEPKPAEPKPAEPKPAEAQAAAKPAEKPAERPSEPISAAPGPGAAETSVAPVAAKPEAAQPEPAQSETAKPEASPAAESPQPGRPAPAARAPASVTAAPAQPAPAKADLPRDLPRIEAPKPGVARPVAPSTAIPPQRSGGGAAPALGPAAAPPRPSAAPPVAGPSLKPPDGSAAPELAAPSLEAGESEAPGLSLDGEKDRPLRPLAPTPEPEKTHNLRGVIIGGVLAAVVGGMGYAAWLLREKPEDLVRARVQQQQQQQTSSESAGKIVERVGGGPATPPAPSQPIPTVRAPATPIRPDQPPAQPSQSPAQATQPAVPVAQRSALLVEAPEDPNKVKLMVGAVTWKAENGQLRAEIDVPEAKLTASMVMKKNDDLTIAASHIMEVRFTFGPDAPYAVKDLAPPEMRRDETPNGDRLAAAVVPITSDYFLVGLARGDREAANMDLIRSRGWFDLPILLQSGRVAKVTFEKGLSGERALEEAAKSW